MFVKMPGTAYPYNVYGIKVPGYTTSSTEAEGDTLFRCQATGGRTSSFSNVSDLAFKNKHIRGRGQVLSPLSPLSPLEPLSPFQPFQPFCLFRPLLLAPCSLLSALCLVRNYI